MHFLFSARGRRHLVLVKPPTSDVIIHDVFQKLFGRDALTLHDAHRVAPRPPVHDVLRPRHRLGALLVQQERDHVVAVGVHVHAAEYLEVRRERDVDLAEREQRLLDELGEIRAEDPVLVDGRRVHVRRVGALPRSTATESAPARTRETCANQTNVSDNQ